VIEDSGFISNFFTLQEKTLTAATRKMRKYIAFVYFLNLKHYRVFAVPEPIFLLEQMYPGREDHNRQKVSRFIQAHCLSLHNYKLHFLGNRSSCYNLLCLSLHSAEYRKFSGQSITITITIIVN